MKVVINSCFGGFGLSPKAMLRMHELGAPIARPYDPNDYPGAKQLLEWQEYLRSGKDVLALHVFTEDQKSYLSFDRSDDALRCDPYLVKVVEELGAAASGRYSNLTVVEIPDGVDYTIEEYDGYEHVAEKHRTWS